MVAVVFHGTGHHHRSVLHRGTAFLHPARHQGTGPSLGREEGLKTCDQKSYG